MAVRTFSYIFILIGVLFVSSVYSQTLPDGRSDISASATLDTGTIRIGEQARLILESTITGDVKTGWFNIQDTIAGLDIVGRSEIDTSVSGDTTRFSQSLMLTGWDSGYYVIPPLPLSYVIKDDLNGKVIETEALLLEVMTVEVDTSKSIRDIKDLKQIPFTWQDALPYIFGSLILALLTWLGLILWKRYRNKDIQIASAEPQRPPFEVAMEAIEELRNKKLWQQGLTKQYYTELIDILRVFISTNWSMNALEMTTDEILELSVIRALEKDYSVQLTQLLVLADLVKFAKSSPGPQDNEIAIETIKKFIERHEPTSDADSESKLNSDV